MEKPILYMRKLIPEVFVELTDDVILHYDEDTLVTAWKTPRPKPDFDHGISLYLLKKGIKISKFMKSDGSLYFWYCDIVDCEFDDTGRMVSNDLLADVVIMPDGFVRVVDLDELAQAAEQNLISEKTLCSVLYRVNDLLQTIHRGELRLYQDLIEQYNQSETPV